MLESKTFHSPKISMSFNYPRQVASKDIHETPPGESTKTIPIFEEFFIVGVESDQLQSQDWDCHDKVFVAPRNLYIHNK